MYGYKDGHFSMVRPRQGRVGRDLLVINIGPLRGHGRYTTKVTNMRPRLGSWHSSTPVIIMQSLRDCVYMICLIYSM